MRRRGISTACIAAHSLPVDATIGGKAVVCDGESSAAAAIGG